MMKAEMKQWEQGLYNLARLSQNIQTGIDVMKKNKLPGTEVVSDALIKTLNDVQLSLSLSLTLLCEGLVAEGLLQGGPELPPAPSGSVTLQ